VSTSEKLQVLFEAAMMEPEIPTPARMIAAPRNPNGSLSCSKDHDTEHFDPRREMLERVNRIKELLSGT